MDDNFPPIEVKELCPVHGKHFTNSGKKTCHVVICRDCGERGARVPMTGNAHVGCKKPGRKGVGMCGKTLSKSSNNQQNSQVKNRNRFGLF